MSLLFPFDRATDFSTDRVKFSNEKAVMDFCNFTNLNLGKNFLNVMINSQDNVIRSHVIMGDNHNGSPK